MKLWIKILIGLLITANSSMGQNWVTTRLTDFAAIDFPVQPQKNIILEECYYTATDQIAKYVVNVKDLRNNTKLVVTPENQSGIYQSFINGALAASNGHQISKKDFEVNGIKGVEINYSVDANSQLPGIRYKRVLYYNKFLFVYDIWTTAEKKDATKQLMDKFFNSFSLSVTSKKRSATNEPNMYQKGYLLGKIIGSLVLIGGLIGVIFLIRFIIKKLQKRNNPPIT